MLTVIGSCYSVGRLSGLPCQCMSDFAQRNTPRRAYRRALRMTENRQFLLIVWLRTGRFTGLANHIATRMMALLVAARWCLFLVAVSRGLHELPSSLSCRRVPSHKKFHTCCSTISFLFSFLLVSFSSFTHFFHTSPLTSSPQSS